MTLDVIAITPSDHCDGPIGACHPYLSEDLAIWIYSDNGLRPTQWDHHRAVCHLAERFTQTLPVRYGTSLESLSDAQTFLAEHHHGLMTKLRFLDNCVEYTLQYDVAHRVQTLDAKPQSGRAYLQAAAKTQSQRQAPLQALNELLERYRNHFQAYGSAQLILGESQRAEAPILITHPQDKLIRALKAEAGLCLMGPWPCYSFADLETNDALSPKL